MSTEIRPRIIVRRVENNFCWGCSLCGAKVKSITSEDSSYPQVEVCSKCGKRFLK